MRGCGWAPAIMELTEPLVLVDTSHSVSFAGDSKRYLRSLCNFRVAFLWHHKRTFIGGAPITCDTGNNLMWTSSADTVIYRWAHCVSPLSILNPYNTEKSYHCNYILINYLYSCPKYTYCGSGEKERGYILVRFLCYPSGWSGVGRSL